MLSLFFITPVAKWVSNQIGIIIFPVAGNFFPNPRRLSEILCFIFKFDLRHKQALVFFQKFIHFPGKPFIIDFVPVFLDDRMLGHIWFSKAF